MAIHTENQGEKHLRTPFRELSTQKCILYLFNVVIKHRCPKYVI